MQDKPYCDLSPDTLILRDHLAIDRTALANERTLLAYMRTALAVVIVGFSLIKFFRTEFFEVLGWCLLPVGLAVLVIGIWRYRQMNDIIRAASAEHHAATQSAEDP